MIKLFVSDLDGTLLNEKHVISPTTASAIKKLQQKDIEFMVATGRTFSTAKPLLQVHDINCQMINLNGAAVYDAQGKAQGSIPLEIETVYDLFTYLSASQTNYSVMTQDNFYVSDKNNFIKRLERMFHGLTQENDPQGGTSAAQFIGEVDYVKELNEYEIAEDDLPLKLMILSQSSQKLLQFRKTFAEHQDIDITSSSIDNLEITHHHAQKGLAVKKYAESNGYTMDEVATIGDSLNDRSMLQMARYSYAMDNASQNVKAMAKYIAPSHREDGVAQVIENILQQF